MTLKPMKFAVATALAAVSLMSLSVKGSDTPQCIVTEPVGDPNSTPCLADTVYGAKDNANQFNIDKSTSQGKNFDLVTFGDSVTENWGSTGIEGSYSKLKIDPNSDGVISMGIGGNRTQNMIYRCENGTLDGYTTKYFTLLAGVNNIYQRIIDSGEDPDDPKDVAEAVRKILNMMLAKHPESKVLLMPILPYAFRYEKNGSYLSNHLKGIRVRENTEEINDIIIRFVDNKRVFWLDLRGKFVDETGLPDFAKFGGPGGSYDPDQCLHPNTSFAYSFFNDAVTNAMLKYNGVAAGTAQCTDPSLGLVTSSQSGYGRSITINLSGIYLGTDANAVPVTQYSIAYELDGGARTNVLVNQTATRNSFDIPNLALGTHALTVYVTTADNKVVSRDLTFTQCDGWVAEALPTDESKIRTDGTLCYAYALEGDYTVNTVPFAKVIGNSIDNDNLTWNAGVAGGGGTPTGVASGDYQSLLKKCWWLNAGSRAVTLKNLTPGHNYLVQIIACRVLDNMNGNVWVNESFHESYSTPYSVRVCGTDWPRGGSLTGVFTADTSATKTFTLVSDGNWAVNAIQVRDLGASGTIPDAPVIDPPGKDDPEEDDPEEDDPTEEDPTGDDPVVPVVPVAGSWSAVPLTAVESSVCTTGTLVYAYCESFNNNYGTNTVNGVPFCTFSDSGDFAGKQSNVSVSPAFSNWSNEFGAEGLSGAYANLIKAGFRSNAGDANVTYTLKNLTAGKTYLVQLFVHWKWAGSALSATVGGKTVYAGGTSWTYGGSLIGVFKAASTEASFTVNYTGYALMNGIQVRELGAGGDDPIIPDPAPVVRSLTIPAKTGLELVSVTTNSVPVAGTDNVYSFFDNAQVTVTFAAASGYEIVSGNPVVLTITADKTLADAEYPVVKSTDMPGGDDPVDPITPVTLGWTASPLAADGSTISTNGTLLYAYRAKFSWDSGSKSTINGVDFLKVNDLSTVTDFSTGSTMSFADYLGEESESNAYGSLLPQGFRNGTAGEMIYTLNGLTAGKTYLVQLLIHRNGKSAFSAYPSEDSSKIVYFGGTGWTFGGSLTGVFKATATSQTIKITYSNEAVFNAIQVRELIVPDPAPEAPVIGGEANGTGSGSFCVTSDKIYISVSNASAGYTYGYKQAATIEGLADAEVIWGVPVESTDGHHVISIDKPTSSAAPSCFYQILVK